MNWTDATLGELCDEGGGEVKTGPFGSQLHQSDYSTDGTPVVMPKDIVGGRITETSIARVGSEHVVRLSKHKMRTGDIVYGRRGDIGRCALITQKEAGWLCGTGCLRISLKDGRVEPQFLFYFLNHPSTVTWIYNQAVGATMPNLNTGILRSVPIRFPVRPTQQRIASILSAYDDLIENNTRRIALLEEMAQRLYEEWFVKGRPEKGETAVDWHWTTLGEICETGGGSIQTGPFGSQLHQRDYQTTGTPLVMPKNIRDGRILADECARVSEEDANRLSKHKLDAFDIVFGRRGEIGRKALVRPHEAGALCGTGCLKVALGSPVVSPFYISEFLSEQQAVADLAGRAIGATMPNLNTSLLAETKIAMPPKQTVERYHELASASDEMTTVLHRKNANLRAQRDLLLPKLVYGDIDLLTAEAELEAAE